MAPLQTALQLWGGVECTINRVDNTFFDQYQRSGHRDRVEADLGCVAALGVKALRLGLQWEHFEATQSWHSFDAMLNATERLGLHPVVGLLHHGSGPTHTDLLDPRFPEKFADYALKVATRYPWVTDYTPINEPHTTSRFSCLYGHWYPHHRSMGSFVRALLNQIRGIVLAMQAIRTVQPKARLIHTEDGGRTFSTPEVDPVRIEREQRRWLGTDLLCGLVTTDHAMFPFLTSHGVSAEEVLWFSENACPPSILGWNYYVTSDRFLDHRTELYDPRLKGGDSGAEPLVDIEAVRVRSEGISSVKSVLCEAWERYRLPVAITEAHLGGDLEDQVRWLVEVWSEAQAARAEGADVRAVAVWALLGSWDWWNLCTEDTGIYERGVFDLSAGRLMPTALATVMAQLARGEAPQHPALTEQGWWHRPDRLTFPPFVLSDTVGVTSA